MIENLIQDVVLVLLILPSDEQHSEEPPFNIQTLTKKKVIEPSLDKDQVCMTCTI